MSRSPRFIVFGASGLIGRAFHRRLSASEALFTYHLRPFPGGIRFDPLNQRLRDLGSDIRSCTHAFILFANSKPDSCYADPVRSRAINVECLGPLVRDLLATGIRPIFTSSEFVFDGTKGSYTEIDQPNPVLVYGRQKLEAEQLLHSIDPSILIFRLAKTFGRERGDRTLFTSWLKELEGCPNRIRCAADQVFSPICIDDVCEAMIRSAEAGLKGLYHLCGERRFTRLELLELLLFKVRMRQDVLTRIEPCSIQDFCLPEKRPADVSMVPARLRATGNLRPKDVVEVCAEIVNEWSGKHCSAFPNH